MPVRVVDDKGVVNEETTLTTTPRVAKVPRVVVVVANTAAASILTMVRFIVDGF